MFEASAECREGAWRVIRCPRCGVFHASIPQHCACGFQLDGVEPQGLSTWFEEIRRILETSYMAAETPWQQSGKSGTLEDWTRARQPIGRCIERSGTVLDIGCANGFLLECLLEWSPFSLTPYGLDFSPPLIELAKARLERYQNNFYVGNAWDWQPPCRFDYVRTELEIVPFNHRASYLHRLLKEVMSEDGRLLVTEYWTRRLDHPGAWLDDWLRSQGFQVERCESGFADNGQEVTRVAVVSGAGV